MHKCTKDRHRFTHHLHTKQITLHTCIHAHTHTHIYMYTCTHAYIHTLTHIETHVPTYPPTCPHLSTTHPSIFHGPIIQNFLLCQDLGTFLEVMLLCLPYFHHHNIKRPILIFRENHQNFPLTKLQFDKIQEH